MGVMYIIYIYILYIYIYIRITVQIIHYIIHKSTCTPRMSTAESDIDIFTPLALFTLSSYTLKRTRFSNSRKKTVIITR